MSTTPRTPDERAVLQALAFFDLFHRPLTMEELQRFAWGRHIGSVVGVVRELDAHGYITADGEYLEPVRDAHRQPRATAHARQRAEQAAPLVARARRFARIAASLPFVRGIFLVNSLALGTNRQGSDIDVLVVTATGHMWLARFLVTLLAQLMGVRRHGTKVAGRLCLSFFLSEEALDLSWMAIHDDVYLTYWVVTAQLLAGSISASALIDDNLWAVDLLPGTPASRATATSPGRVQRASELLLRRTGIAWCAENLLRLVLGRRTRRAALRQGVSHPEDLVNDRVQKFHDRDRRAEFRDRWLQRCEQLGAALR